VRQIQTFGRYFRKKYGYNVYKIPVSIQGLTCPNIDGTVARGGCIFCENESFSPDLSQKSRKFYLHPDSEENPYLDKQLKQLELTHQANAIKLKKKFDAKKFLIYFQSFSNTYAPLSTLQRLYERALDLEDVIGLSIGTRSDVIDVATLKYIKSLSNSHEIWVEYGVQSMFDTTLESINRGHDVQNIKETIKKSKDMGLKVCAHLIYGLPNETQEMMLESLAQTIALGVDSIKFHPMYVVKNTALAVEWMKERYEPISEALYIDTLVKSIQMLPGDIIIQRLTAGIQNDTLLTPSWCYEKHASINKIKQAFLQNGFIY
jgi:radical SAM protein (TIGR01212 family)